MLSLLLRFDDSMPASSYPDSALIWPEHGVGQAMMTERCQTMAGGVMLWRSADGRPARLVEGVGAGAVAECWRGQRAGSCRLAGRFQILLMGPSAGALASTGSVAGSWPAGRSARRPAGLSMDCRPHPGTGRRRSR